MKNYQDSDYALNKFSAGIVYRFADGVVEVTLEDFLKENPDKTETDFQALKNLSDEMYLEIDRKSTAQARKDIPLHNAVELADPTALSVEEQFEEKEEIIQQQIILRIIKNFLNSDKLTPCQVKRFNLYYIYGLLTRKIAKIEGVKQSSVWKSLQWCERKLKKFLEK